MITDPEAGLQKKQSAKEILLELNELRARLDEAEQTLDAIRGGDVDALVVYGDEGEKVYTLKGADEPYRIFVEQMKEGAVTLTREGTILYCNQSFARMLNLPLEKVIGIPIRGLLLSREGRDLLDICAASEASSQAEEMTVSRDGELVPVLVSFARLQESEGAVESLAVTVTDLSRQREQENQLKRANEELEGFCYTASHDLRAPLRSIVSSANVVIEDFASLLPPEARADLERISQSANQLGMLIDDLLTYSRLSTHPLETGELDLSALAWEIVAEGVWERKDDIEWRIERGIRAVGDRQLLRLVLENLMSNAAKYSSKRTNPVIEIGSVDDRIAFVRDNGIGFDMRYVDRIFLPFERLHVRSEYPGTGIGLANAKRIVNKHGGRIWAESRPGEGATFFFQTAKVDNSSAEDLNGREGSVE